MDSLGSDSLIVRSLSKSEPNNLGLFLTIWDYLWHTDSVALLESFRALKLTLLESFRALKS